MKRYVEREKSIYVQILLLLVVAAAIAGGLFLILDRVGEYSIDRYIENSDYIETRTGQAVSGLQDYISENRVYSRDAESLYKWVKKQKLLSLSIYKDGIQVFDSTYPDQQIWNEEIASMEYEWVRYDTVLFEDGNAEIRLTGAWSYQLYSYMIIIEIIVCFLVFLTVVLLGIRIKMRYIRQLSEEVEVLEGGTLNWPITVRGCDELTVLAEGLDSMRRNFLDSQEREMEMVRSHRRVITEMSHDLRTPVTSIMLYAEILLADKNEDENQRKQYIKKINQKAMQIKERTDNLLNYSLHSCRETGTELQEGSFPEALHDLLSETCGYLEQRGFLTELNLQWMDSRICYNADYLVRIMDNIMSNIVKYAAPQFPVMISLAGKEDEIVLKFQNKIPVRRESAEGTGIGIQSISAMMKEMGGRCRSECRERNYIIELMFPLIKSEENTQSEANSAWANASYCIAKQ